MINPTIPSLLRLKRYNASFKNVEVGRRIFSAFFSSFGTILKDIGFSDISFHKVKGHSDDEGNNRADELANIAMDELEV